MKIKGTREVMNWNEFELTAPPPNYFPIKGCENFVGPCMRAISMEDTLSFRTKPATTINTNHKPSCLQVTTSQKRKPLIAKTYKLFCTNQFCCLYPILSTTSTGKKMEEEEEEKNVPYMVLSCLTQRFYADFGMNGWLVTSFTAWMKTNQTKTQEISLSCFPFTRRKKHQIFSWTVLCVLS